MILRVYRKNKLLSSYLVVQTPLPTSSSLKKLEIAIRQSSPNVEK